MATPKHDPEYELKKKTAKELIAAGGCYALYFWSRTDAERLCPEVHIKFNDTEVPYYISDWVKAGKKAVELIQEGINLLDPPTQKTLKTLVVGDGKIPSESLPTPFPKPSMEEGLKELIDIRNKLYDALPDGNIDAFELIQIIKWHINDIDNFCSRIAALSQNNSEGWVRFEDKLPEAGQEVFIVWPSGNIHPEYRVMKEDDLNQDWETMRWMPVPNYQPLPPKP